MSCGTSKRALLRRHSALLVVLLVALVMRLWGISFGLPYQYHVDEPQYVVQAAQMLEARSLRPAWFNNPPLAKYAMMAADAGVLSVGMLLGRYSSPGDFADKVTADHSALYLAGRLLSVLYGVLTVVAVYLLGARAYGLWAGLGASTLLSVLFIHVRESHYATNDSLFTLWTTLIVLVAVLSLKRRSRALDIGSGVLCGLAVATKYTGVLLLAPVIASHVLSARHTGSGLAQLAVRMSTVVLSAALSAVLVSPYFILDSRAVMADIQQYLLNPSSNGQFYGWILDARGGYAFYANSIGIGMGVPLAIASAIAVVHTVVSRSAASLVIATVPVMFFVVLGSQDMFFARFLLPAVPCLAVLVAHSVYSGVKAIEARWPRAPVNAMAWTVLAILILPTLLSSVLYGLLLTQTDTRTEATMWIEDNIPEGSVVAVDWPVHGPPLSTSADRQPGSLRQYKVVTANGLGLSVWPLSEFCSQHVEYVVVSSFVSSIPISDVGLERRRRDARGLFDATMVKLYEVSPYRPLHRANFTIDQIYGPWDQLLELKRPGPLLVVYRVKHCGES